VYYNAEQNFSQQQIQQTVSKKADSNFDSHSSTQLTQVGLRYCGASQDWTDSITKFLSVRI